MPCQNHQSLFPPTASFRILAGAHGQGKPRSMGVDQRHPRRTGHPELRCGEREPATDSAHRNGGALYFSTQDLYKLRHVPSRASVMNTNPIDPDRRAELIGKYIDIDPKSPPPWLADDAASLGADAQTAVAAIPGRSRAAHQSNRRGPARLRRVEPRERLDHMEVTPELRDRIDRAKARIREAQRLDAMARVKPGEGIMRYDDNRDKYDELAGWVPHDPDNPFMHGYMFGTIVADPETLHVLRGGALVPRMTRSLTLVRASTPRRSFGSSRRDADTSLGRMGCRPPATSLPDGCNGGMACMETPARSYPPARTSTCLTSAAHAATWWREPSTRPTRTSSSAMSA